MLDSNLSVYELESTMQIQGPENQEILNEFAVLRQLLPLTSARVLELGCGAAETTRQIAERMKATQIVAAEVDQLQHDKNRRVTDLPNVTFKSYGAEAIDEPDNSFDIVLMFNSLHHVPVESMDQAIEEIRRVLKPGGLAYISEPVFAGEFNEVTRLFHDESEVRRKAFEALARAVDRDRMELVEEKFFKKAIKLTTYEQFEQGLLKVTHTDFDLTPSLLHRVREKFESYASDAGFVFQIPNRVDMLRKAAG